MRILTACQLPVALHDAVKRMQVCPATRCATSRLIIISIQEDRQSLLTSLKYTTVVGAYTSLILYIPNLNQFIVSG